MPGDDGPRASRALRLAVVLALLALALAGAANHELWTYDEPREAELARAMWRSGNHVYTVLGERPFLEKPPLFSATVAFAFSLAGEATAPLARVVAALWSLVTLGTVWWLARREIGERAGLVAALVLATSGRFFSIAHTILLDNALGAFTTLALATGWVAGRERRLGLASVTGLALAGAFLTKGLVGVGIVGSVLALDLAFRRDARGLRTLAHPLPIACALLPVLAYAFLLYRTGGENGREYLHEMLWNNQFGRFVSGYATRNEKWYVYWKGWPEMLAPWTPLALVALLWSLKETFTAEAQSAQRSRRDAGTDMNASPAEEPLCVSSAIPAPLRFRLSFFATWSLLPLILLTCSSAKARNYALPVLPAYALLIAQWWHSCVLGHGQGPEAPLWGKRLFRVLTQLGPLALLVAGLGVLGLDLATYDPVDMPPRDPFHPGERASFLEVCSFDRALLAACLLALAAGTSVLRHNRGGRLVSRESGALLLGLIVVAGFLGSTTTYLARRGNLSRSYEDLARETWKQAGSRRLLLFHANDSWSGTFAFLAGRSTPEFNELWDPHGERLLAALGPSSRDVVLAPRGALEAIDLPARTQLAIEWTGYREEDRPTGERPFVLVHRRGPDEPPRDPLAPERGP